MKLFRPSCCDSLKSKGKIVTLVLLPDCVTVQKLPTEPVHVPLYGTMGGAGSFTAGNGNQEEGDPTYVNVRISHLIKSDTALEEGL